MPTAFPALGQTIKATADKATAYSYVRVSTSLQELSESDQQVRNREFYDQKLAKLGILWGGHFIDRAKSAYKKPFLKREAGLALQSRIQKGDHVIVTKFDRAFRNLKDGVNITTDWFAKGITVHILNFPVDTTTRMGQLMIQLLAWVGEVESTLKSERNREAYAEKIRQGGKKNRGYPGYGFKWAGKKGHKKVVNEYELGVMRLIVEWKAEGHSWYEIAVSLWKQGVYWKPERKQEWSRARVQRAYEEMLRLKEEWGDWLPPKSDLPPPDNSSTQPGC